ncbi:TnsD family Tn7-like transposition protein [Pseudomonas donghuensis]|uniref:TnsD family Tn7-like transposition protein n=1 Tax=Pseudomonas donghuensis TaxID=1163398 RepID=UPI00031BAAA3|nr:TnsD family Tn7-like transposition protein [Pseudomonas donghuensis]
MNLTSKQPPYLHWLQDECFYSLCSRQHIFMGSQSQEETLNFLFGDSATAFAHDFPKNLNLLNERARSCWGSPDNIICEHTISPIFFPFQSPENIQKLKLALSGPQLGSLKYKLGLVTGRFGGAHPLKACLKCMTADTSAYGSTYWHLSHQIPGVTTCPIHGFLLLESTENRQWSRGYQWLLPDENALVSTSQTALSPATSTALQTMSKSAIALCKMGITTRFDPNTVALVYKEAFSKLGASQQAREAAADCFAQRCSELQPYPPFTALPCSRRCAIGFISQMTRKPRGYCHPLKHLTLISWLFGRLESFVDAYQQAAKDLHVLDDSHCQKLVLAQTVDEQLPQAERQTGAPRPKKIRNELKDKILNAMLTGASKKEVCSRFEVSISTVNRLLRLNPLCCQQFINNRYLEKCAEQREVWCSTVNQMPNASANKIKKLVPKVYAWLYRNDRTWLMSQTSALPSGRSGNHVAVDWDARDENLCVLIKQMLETSASGFKKIRKRDLYQLVPSLFCSLEQKSHYSKTRRLLSEIPH